MVVVVYPEFPSEKLLVASHILPWGEFPAERLNPQNGLCLSRLHDAAFDNGLITFDDDYRLVVSRDLKSHFRSLLLNNSFGTFAGRPLTTPAEATPPSATFLATIGGRFSAADATEPERGLAWRVGQRTCAWDVQVLNASE